MLLRNLNEVWVSEYEKIDDHAEKIKKWKFKAMNTKSKTAFLNIQQDINELDRNSAGEVDYSILKARTTSNYQIIKGNGISLTSIERLDKFEPEYIVTDMLKIGMTVLYKLEKNNGV